MKIGHQPELPSALAQTRPVAAPVAEGLAKSASAALAAGAPVTVSFSRGARELESASPVGRPSADFDTERVKAMRAAIESGTFQVNAGAIADKLLSHAQETLTRTPSFEV